MKTPNAPLTPATSREDVHKLQLRLARASVFTTIGEITGGIAHEINQPLTAIANYAQACDRMLGNPNPDIPEIQGALQEITAQAVRAGELIHRLRAFARGDQKDREPTDVNSLLGELYELIRLDTATHGVRCKLELAQELPPVSVDRTQIQTVIIHLIRNAVEALAEVPAAAREISVCTRLLTQSNVEIAVSDTGPGVPTNIAPRLFEPFCTAKPRGTGLGLAISRTIVKAHRGMLDYRPNTPTGACFVVQLPIAPQVDNGLPF
jgi:two-component system, LuxR family, sensor kinase FixL